MAINYIEMRLEDCMDAIIDYRGKTPKKVDNGIPLITAKIIKNGRIQEVSEFIAIDDYDNWMVRGLPLEGDVVLTTEAPLGEVAQLDARKVALAQRVITLRGKKGTLENDYLLYLLQSSFVQNQLDGRASGSTVTGIKQSELREIILRLPPTALQKSISHQLKCLDKKIDLNNKINQTLEQISQTLFKSWFVDFDPVIDNTLDAGNPIPEALQSRAELRQKVRNSADFKPLPADIRALFPAEFEETELGWVPKGWILESVAKAININPSVKLPKNTVAKYVDMKSLPTQGYSISDVIEKPYAGGAKFQKNDTLFARITPCLENGKTGFVDFLDEQETAFGSTEFIVMRGTTKVHYSYVACLARENNFRLHAIQNMVGSSGRQRVQNSCFDSFYIAVPTPSVMSLFAGKVSSYFDKMYCCNMENKSLTNLRDTLLPKLISGKLSLEDLPDLVNQTEAA
ncbi:TPA: restriction endonuclease subunit S [Salmonella enterica subsp. enterica serovar Enteritidis]|uniref:restriction endonuclease subunit S n=1 Tax=Salmonella enterica TaxID=28901 RepID=UPI0012A819E7|nr:restriction endonuclease subunit S [Salmonella enterica]ECS7801936.1 restriction endonuclease subunit S [Salmonella enterica subsp. enterica serovar Enteritidis]ECT9818419.1 restriction endonuclease subunit S [Salmonella enterica subsp. enterica serovar Enteritidis]EDR9659247.1 restriction endonuclease subunit S [Salmonella enterica subsp. enterica serovar Enteritidis]EDU3586966.1 restriction endonuclease subunit S [Salmonella enterica subsp. enterica serovar Enteritidis]EDX5944470.1 restri